VVVIPDAVGVSDDIREQADRLPAAGYQAFALDLYSGRGLRCVLATMAACRSGGCATYDDIEPRGARCHRDGCIGRIGVIGYCMGGGFNLLSAAKSDFGAASVNYGEVAARIG
jgi:carboxymethylenebutenolidase